MLINIIQKINKKILDFIFPQNEFEKKVSDLTKEDICLKIPRKTFEDKNIYAIFDYKNKIIRQLIWSFKFKNNKKVARVFAEIIYDEILENLSDLETFSNFSNPLLIPIPISKQRKRERGYNQSELIAKNLSLLDMGGSFVYEKNILIKIKDTPPQSRIKNKEERLINLKNCFDVKTPEKIKGRNIILIDDVVTTGATFSEAKKTLRKYDAKKIIAITVAH